MNDLAAISSWSGGKDSCFACYKAMTNGYQVKYLLNFISKEYKRCCFHGIEAKLLKLQTEAIGIPLVQKEVSPDMKKYEEEYLNGNLTAMIDVVFQLIIFFVCTVSMQDTAVDERIRMALAPHGTVVEKKDPAEINVDVDTAGYIYIARTPYTKRELTAILTKVVQDNRGRQVPLIIRGDSSTRHEAIQRVMDACAEAGIWKVKFAALKERG